MVLNNRDLVISEMTRMETLLAEIQERITHIDPLSYRRTRPSIKPPTDKNGKECIGTPQERKDFSRLQHLAMSTVIRVGAELTPGYEFDDANLIKLRLLQLQNKLDFISDCASGVCSIR